MGNKTLKDIPTCALVEELKEREAVGTHFIEPHASFTVLESDKKIQLPVDSGPCTLLVIWD